MRTVGERASPTDPADGDSGPSRPPKGQEAARPPSRRAFLAGAAGLLAPAVVTGAAPVPRASRTAPHLRDRPFPPPAPGQEVRFDLVVTGGTLVDPAAGIHGPRDVAVLDGRVARVAESIAPGRGRQVLDATGRIVTPGLIDLHVHVYPGVASVGIEPDLVGVARGVTTLVDGGSAGATTFPGFRTYVVRRARTRVYGLLNLSSPGMTVPNETLLLDWLDADAAAETVAAHPDVLVGIKVRMLAGIPAGQDVEVMRRARAAADRAGVPVMVHIGGQTSPCPASSTSSARAT